MSRSQSSAKRRAPAKDTGAAAAARKAAIQAQSGVERRIVVESTSAPVYPIGKGRKHLKGISIFMHPIAKETLDRISKEHRKTVQDLGLEALNLLFRQYGEKPVA